MNEELNRLKTEHKRINERINAIETAARNKENAVLIGKCFKYRNSYSSPGKPSDCWWYYSIILEAADGGLYAFEFQTDKNGDINIKPRSFVYGVLEGQNVIPRKEFYSAWRQTQKHIASLAEHF